MAKSVRAPPLAPVHPVPLPTPKQRRENLKFEPGAAVKKKEGLPFLARSTATSSHPLFSKMYFTR
jgi:hypothetical protein